MASTLKYPAAPLLGLATLTALSLASVPAHAQTTISFDNFTAQAQANGGFFYVGTTYSTQGFTLNDKSPGLYAYAGGSSYSDGETSLQDSSGGTTTLTQDNAQVFSLNAIDLGPFRGSLLGTFYSGPTLFTGTRADGTTVTAIKTTTSSQFQTFSFTGFTDLTSLALTPQGGVAAPLFDNIVLDSPAAVPEASTSLGFGVLLALGTAGAALRARKRQAV